MFVNQQNAFDASSHSDPLKLIPHSLEPSRNTRILLKQRFLRSKRIICQRVAVKPLNSQITRVFETFGYVYLPQLFIPKSNLKMFFKESTHRLIILLMVMAAFELNFWSKFVLPWLFRLGHPEPAMFGALTWAEAMAILYDLMLC